MIGIVVVAHSRPLAEAAVALAGEMTPGSTGPPVRVAAGLDADTLGTDAAAVAEAITEADAASEGEGVLVLLDLGSAVLSADMALEMLDPDVAGRVRLSGAPLVEGLVIAVLTAAGGRPLDKVASEAENALLVKGAKLSQRSAP